MEKEIRRHPLAVAWEKWLASEEGQECREVSTVHANHYLENRLHRAFDAGVKAQEKVETFKLERE